MRIISSYHGAERVWETPETEVVFGRAEDNASVILDLAPDQRVSRIHGRIWQEEGLFWIEDLNSSRGTQLNGVEIKGRGKQQVRHNDSITVGQTALRLDLLEGVAALSKTNYLEHGTVLLPEKRHAESGVAIAKDVDATSVDPLPIPHDTTESARRLKMVCDLPFQFASKTSLESLLPAIVDHLVAVMPSAESWALVLREPGTEALLLKAYHFVQKTYLSETLLRRAMADRKAFLWKRTAEADMSGSIAQSDMEVGMYAPLIWQGEALGALCAGARSSKLNFVEDDLRLLVLVAHYAAMAVSTYHLREKLRQESVVKANLLRQFSPKVADRMLAHRGRVRLGGQRSEVTVLNSDIRGFTQLAHEMEPDEVVEMLNEYLGVCVPVIFAHNGTVDKFMGDAILAVFGSPEPDPAQHENAVRAGMEMQAAVARLNEARKLRGVPCRDFGIGIHCGEVVHGFVGTAERMEFTVIGDAVNRASRYCAAAGGGEVLISPEMHERVWRIVEAEAATIHTKHEGDFPAYRVGRFKENASQNAASG